MGKTVCITGGSGFIASWIVKYLLQRGYNVHATDRDPDDPEKTGHLLAFEGAKDRLKLFKADLLEEGSFDVAINGCDGVLHTASPFKREVDDPQKELIDPALKGTLNVLRSCAKSPSVKRVVLTSSIAAVTFNDRLKSPDVVVDETWFSDPNLCKEMKLWYVLSKTLAEDAAWKFANENCMDMVVINPGMVIGHLLQPTLNTSVATVLNLIVILPMPGAQTYPNNSYGWVNVKDVAKAHIQAFENPSASGRYILVDSVVHFSQIVDTLRKLDSSFELPQRPADEKPFVPIYQYSHAKAKTLGIEYFIPLEDSLKETIESLKEKGLIKV